MIEKIKNMPEFKEICQDRIARSKLARDLQTLAIEVATRQYTTHDNIEKENQEDKEENERVLNEKIDLIKSIIAEYNFNLPDIIIVNKDNESLYRRTLDRYKHKSLDLKERYWDILERYHDRTEGTLIIASPEWCRYDSGNLRDKGATIHIPRKEVTL